RPAIWQQKTAHPFLGVRLRRDYTDFHPKKSIGLGGIFKQESKLVLAVAAHLASSGAQPDYRDFASNRGSASLRRICSPEMPPAPPSTAARSPAEPAPPAGGPPRRRGGPSGCCGGQRARGAPSPCAPSVRTACDRRRIP